MRVRTWAGAQIYRPEDTQPLLTHEHKGGVIWTTRDTVLWDIWAQRLRGTGPGHGMQGAREGGLLARLHWNHEKRVEGVGLEVPEGSPRRALGAQSVCHTLLSSFTTSS